MWPKMSKQEPLQHSTYRFLLKLLLAESLDPQSIVSCFPTTDCGGGKGANGTLDGCCKHGVEPFGLSYLVSRRNSCQLCPVGKNEICESHCDYC